MFLLRLTKLIKSTHSTQVRARFLLVAPIVLAASCGGGDSSSSESDVELTLNSSANIQFNLHEDGVGPFDLQSLFRSVDATISKPIANVYFEAEYIGDDVVDSLNIEVFAPDFTEGRIVVRADVPGALGRGAFFQSIRVRVCADSACRSELIGSPVVLNIEYNVSPNDRYSLDVTATPGGTVSQKNGPFNCRGDCTSEIYVDKNTDIVLSANPEPGYRFAGWEGDCGGTEQCTLPYSEDTASISAIFEENPEPYTPCLSSSYSTGITGTIDVGYTSRIIPLCNEYVFLARLQNNEISLLNVVTGDIERTYTLSSNVGALAVDEENMILYSHHGASDFISRIDIQSGHIGEFYVHYAFLGSQGASGTRSSVEVSDAGVIIASTSSQLESFPENPDSIWFFDSSTTNFIKRIKGIRGVSEFLYVDQLNALTMIDRSSSETRLHSYRFDQESIDLNFEFSRNRSGGTTCRPGTLSPNGQNLVIPCYADREAMSTPNLAARTGEVQGAWQDTVNDTASFSPSGNNIAFGHNSLRIYSTESYELIQEVQDDYCGLIELYEPRRNTSFSPEGNFVFRLNTCSQDANRLIWTSFNDQ